MKTEYDIHDIIKTYPYLLELEYNDLTIKHEKIYEDRTRADFIFTNKIVSIVIEVKIGNINISTLYQAYHYLENEVKENPNKKMIGILIGKRIQDKDKLINEIKKSKYEIRIKLLKRDIPIDIKICEECRKANNFLFRKCKYCGSDRFIKDSFLFID